MATLFYNTEAAQIKALFFVNDYFKISNWNLFYFGATWYVFTIFTYGVVIPAGLFLPGIIMGGAMGRVYTGLVQYIVDYESADEAQQNAVLGASAMLAGYCRLTYSLTVIMLETTQAVNLFIPFLLAMLSSYATALIFNQSLYFNALRTKQVPMLTAEVPTQNLQLRAKVIMKENPITLTCVPTVKRISECLKMGFSTFPIVNESGYLVGNISNNFLIVLIEKRAFYRKSYTLQNQNQASMDVNDRGTNFDNLASREPGEEQSLKGDVQQLLARKSTMKKSSALKKSIATDEANVMERIGRIERRGSETDLT